MQVTHLPALLRLIEDGRFDPTKVAPMIGSWADADRVLLERATKVVVKRDRLHS